MTGTIQLNFTRFDDTIVCTDFDCGEASLNRFLTVRALTEMSQRLSVTTVALNETRAVIGFYSISPAQIAKESLSKKEGRGIPYDLIPGIRIGRLAIKKNAQGKGFGALLLRHALLKCLNISQEFGGRVVIVDAKNEKAAAFYIRYGFKPIKNNPFILVLKISTLAQLTNPPRVKDHH